MAKIKKKPDPKSDARDKLASAVRAHVKARAELADFRAKHAKVLDIYADLQSKVSDAEGTVTALAKQAVSMGKVGSSTIYAGSSYTIVASVSRPRQVDFDALVKACPAAMSWKGLAKVTLKEFDAACSAGIIDDETAEAVVSLGNPSVKVSLKPNED